MENKEAVNDQHVFPQAQENKSKNFQRNIIFIFGSLFVVAVVAGVFTVAVGGESLLSSQQDKIGDVCSRASACERVKAASSDYISVIFDNRFATSRLSKAIAGTENNYNRKVKQNLTVSNFCTDTGLNNPVLYKEGEDYKDLVIAVFIMEFDGKGGAVAAGGTCIYNQDLGIPLVSLLHFDPEDISKVHKFGKMEELVLHEMMHALGYGIIWTPILRFGGGFRSNFTIIEDQVLSKNEKGEIVVHPKNKPKYTGAEGVAEFEKLIGEAESFIPIQGTKLFGEENYFNVSLGEGITGIDGHIDKDTFGVALMTLSMNYEVGVRNPLTAMSLGMLRDIGYTVDISVAGVYSLPQIIEKVRYNLRGQTEEYFDLSNDAFRKEPANLDFFSLNSVEEPMSNNRVSFEDFVEQTSN
eukprot:snap_masked-scaffold_6-processed-gene-5.36-mRNA-1 protein AED:1.00 eAED:1.00 QI:0/0/0/0/1/1/4/0/410